MFAVTQLTLEKSAKKKICDPPTFLERVADKARPPAAIGGGRASKIGESASGYFRRDFMYATSAFA